MVMIGLNFWSLSADVRATRACLFVCYRTDRLHLSALCAEPERARRPYRLGHRTDGLCLFGTGQTKADARWQLSAADNYVLIADKADGCAFALVCPAPLPPSSLLVLGRTKEAEAKCVCDQDDVTPCQMLVYKDQKFSQVKVMIHMWSLSIEKA